MEKKKLAIVIACFVIFSFSAVALSRVEFVETFSIHNIGEIRDTAAPTEALGIQDSPNAQNDVSQDASDSQTTVPDAPSELPTPIPDGRIFPPESTTEEPIAYIPTESPKPPATMPFLPPELDG